MNKLSCIAIRASLGLSTIVSPVWTFEKKTFLHSSHQVIAYLSNPWKRLMKTRSLPRSISRKCFLKIKDTNTPTPSRKVSYLPGVGTFSLYLRLKVLTTENTDKCVMNKQWQWPHWSCFLCAIKHSATWLNHRSTSEFSVKGKKVKTVG